MKGYKYKNERIVKKYEMKGNKKKLKDSKEIWNERIQI